MVWQSEVDELNHRRRLAEKMGGEERVARQHEQGKLTVRERIALLADPGSFQEIGTLTGNATYDDNGKLVSFTSSSSIIGICTVDGRQVVIDSQDFTAIRGGGGGGGHMKGNYASGMALDWRMPYVRILEAYA